MSALVALRKESVTRLARGVLAAMLAKGLGRSRGATVSGCPRYNRGPRRQPCRQSPVSVDLVGDGRVAGNGVVNRVELVGLTVTLPPSM